MSEAVQMDIFTVNAIDPPWRDNRDAMEYPFLSLQKKRTKPIEFSKKGLSLSVAADIRYSIATIWDWDIIIFAASHLNEAVEGGFRSAAKVRFVPYDCLRQIGRGTSGRHYRELAQAIRRLRMTTVVTNIRYDDDAGEERPFSWLSSYSIPKRYSPGAITPDAPDGEPDPARPWEVELPPWLYNAIIRRRDILAVHPDYFQLTGGLERWLYRLARKSVPDRAEIPAIHWRMDTLHAQSGSTRPLKQFAFDIRKIAEAQPLPEYGLKVERQGKNELVILYLDRAKPRRLPRGMKRLAIDGGA